MARRGLGASADTHEYQAFKGLRKAARALREVNSSARRGHCYDVWNNLMIAQANVSHAYANIESYPASKSMQHRHLQLQRETTRLVTTLGFQCALKPLRGR